MAAPDRELLARYVEAFERYDMAALTALIQEDATQSMPPFELWLARRDDILSWSVGFAAEIEDGRIVEFTFFLTTDTLLPLFGLPARLDS